MFVIGHPCHVMQALKNDDLAFLQISICWEQCQETRDMQVSARSPECCEFRRQFPSLNEPHPVRCCLTCSENRSYVQLCGRCNTESRALQANFNTARPWRFPFTSGLEQPTSYLAAVSTESCKLAFYDKRRAREAKSWRYKGLKQPITKKKSASCHSCETTLFGDEYEIYVKRRRLKIGPTKKDRFGWKFTRR